MSEESFQWCGSAKLTGPLLTVAVLKANMGRLLAVICPLVACAAAQVLSDRIVLSTVDSPSGSTERPVVRIGAPLALDRYSRFQTFSHIMLRNYELFFNWLNNVRGGISVGGVMHRAELVLLGDLSDAARSLEATRHLVEDLGIKLLLGPYGSESTLGVARFVNGTDAVMVAPASETVFPAGTTRVFGIIMPSTQYLLPAFDLLGPRVRSVIAIKESAGFSDAVCSTIPAEADKHSITDMGSMILAIDPSEASGEITPAEAVARLKTMSPQPELLFGCVYESVCLEFIKQARLQNYQPAMMVSTICVTLPSFIEELGDTGRWIIGITPWVSTNSITSDFTGWTVEEYSEHYEAHAGEVPPYQGASAWASCEVLVSAIEAAGSADPHLVNQALIDIDVQTIFGQVNFDGNGQNNNAIRLVQHWMGDTVPRIVAPADAATDTAVFPIPPWESHPCYADSAYSVYGFVANSSECVDCTRQQPSQVGRFDWALRMRFCETCPEGFHARATVAGDETAICSLDCEPGFVSEGPRCRACLPGTRQLDRSCEFCPSGSFTNMSAMIYCESCPLGKFTDKIGSSICWNCPPGRARGGEECTPCFAGLYAEEGSPVCTRCPLGQAAAVEGSTACEVCAPGNYSVWGNVACRPCPAGSYQPLPGTDRCTDVGRGAEAAFEGMTQPVNAKYYWDKWTGTQVQGQWQATIQPEPCKFWPDACLANERCEEGHAGRQCLACIPGHMRKSGGCFACNSRWLHAVVSILVLALVTLVNFVFVYCIHLARSRPTEIHTILFKQFLNHLVMTSVCREMFDHVLGEMSSTDVSRDALSVGKIIISLVDWGDGMLPILESRWWSLGCLTESQLTDAQYAQIEQLERANHSYFSHPDMDGPRSTMRAHSIRSIVAQTILYTIWPILLNLLISLIGAISLLRDLRTHQEDYKDTFTFFREVHLTSFRRAKKKIPHSVWKLHVDSYFKRLMGLFWPARHMRNYLDKGRFDVAYWWAECHPLRLVAVFVAFPGAVRGVLRGLYCVELGEDDPSVLLTRSEVVCELPVMVPSILGAIIWCVIYPVWLYIGLRRAFANSLLGGEESTTRWAVFFNGYTVEFWWWELVIYIRKIAMLAIMVFPFQIWNPQGRAVSFLLAAVFFFFLQQVCEPYDKRVNNTLQIMEFHHLASWIVMAALLKVLSVGSTAWLAVVCPIVAVVVHFIYMLRLLGTLYVPLLSFLGRFVAKESMDDMWEGSLRRLVCQHILEYPARQEKQQTLLAFDHLYGWVTLVGHAQSSAVPHIPKGVGPGVRLNGMARMSEELHLHSGQPPNPKTMQRVHTVIEKTKRYILVERADTMTSVLSACMLDFLVRAAFVIHLNSRAGKDRMFEPQEAELAVWSKANISHDPLALQRVPGESLKASTAAKAAQAGGGGEVHTDEQFDELRGSIMEEQLREEHIAVLFSKAKIRTLRKNRERQRTAEGKGDEAAHDLMKERIMLMVDMMFSASTFRKCLTLEDFEAALLQIERYPHKELILWLNHYEMRWWDLQNRIKQEIYALAGRFRDMPTITTVTGEHHTHKDEYWFTPQDFPTPVGAPKHGTPSPREYPILQRWLRLTVGATQPLRSLHPSMFSAAVARRAKKVAGLRNQLQSSKEQRQQLEEETEGLVMALREPDETMSDPGGTGRGSRFKKDSSTQPEAKRRSRPKPAGTSLTPVDLERGWTTI